MSLGEGLGRFKERTKEKEKLGFSNERRRLEELLRATLKTDEINPLGPML